MDSREAFIEMRRGDVVESIHRVSAALVDERGQLIAYLGEPDMVTYFRSAAKPFQALPLVAEGAADALELSEVELAICCSSHAGEPAHVESVLGILARIGCTEKDLECGPHAPFHKPSADALQKNGRPASPVHNNCSGKHTGMLALAKHLGVETRGYRRGDHPVQMRIRKEIAEWTGQQPSAMLASIDGCGVLTYAQAINDMAAAYARLVASAEADPTGPAGRITRAMTGEPYYVAGTDRLATDIMQGTGGRILAKSGAEGVFCLADRDSRRGLAVKIEDGQKRAAGPAVVEFLAQAGMASAVELAALDGHRATSIENTLGEIVGELRPAYRIRRSE